MHVSLFTPRYAARMHAHTACPESDLAGHEADVISSMKMQEWVHNCLLRAIMTVVFVA